MKKKSEPVATLMAFSTLVIIGVSTKHCMKKYTGARDGRRLRILFRR